MTLPRKPERSAPIPNQPFESPEVTTVKGPYWEMSLGSGLEVDGQGSVQTTGSEPSEPTAMLYGPNGFVGVGAGLQIGANGELEQSGSGYIYCTPSYPELPVTYPPYGCNTEVNTAGVTDFSSAWYSCDEIVEFPCIDSSSVTNFSTAWQFCTSLSSFPKLNVSSGLNFFYTWCNCTSLTSFPLIDVSSGANFNSTWAYCTSLTSFPLLDVSSGEDFTGSWYRCSGLTSFPLLNVSSGVNFFTTWYECTSLITFPKLNFISGTNFNSTWYGCSSLSSFPAGVFDNCSATNFFDAWANCALSQQSVDNILISLDTAGQSNGIVSINGGTSATPSLAGWNAVASLEGKGWTVVVNGVSPFATPEEEQESKFPENPEPEQLFTDTEGKLYEWGRSLGMGAH